jgi:undecaprenyl diphosphate synthase
MTAQAMPDPHANPEAGNPEAAEPRAKPLKVPRHVAIIMDGNGRWAKARGLPRILGHREGRKSVRDVVETASRLGIEYLTLYTFSSENWNRPRAEVQALMRFLDLTLIEEREELRKNNVRLRTIGHIGDLPPRVQRVLAETIDYLSASTGLTLVLALSYGGRDEILDAARRLAEACRRGELEPENIGPAEFAARLQTEGIPDPDLVIRTSGEMRISNFLLWQLAYSEIYITKVLWPDFRGQHLIEAVEEFNRRERRFGRLA